MDKIRDILSNIYYALFYWPRPSGHYKRRSWPEVELHGQGTEEEPWRLAIVQADSTRGRTLWFEVVDWIDDHTGHKMCNSDFYQSLWRSVQSSEPSIAEIPISVEQVRALNPDHYYLPENQEDDEDE